MMKVRPANAADIATYTCDHPVPTIRAWVGEVDGKIVGISGLFLQDGRWFIFCDLSEEAKKYPMTIARNAHRVMAEARTMGIRYIYAIIDPLRGEPRAIAWLGTLGFEPDERSDGNLYRWRA